MGEDIWVALAFFGVQLVMIRVDTVVFKKKRKTIFVMPMAYQFMGLNLKALY